MEVDEKGFNAATIAAPHVRIGVIQQIIEAYETAIRSVGLTETKGECQEEAKELGVQVPGAAPTHQPVELTTAQRMEVLRTATMDEIDCIPWEDKSQNMPLISQIHENLYAWKALAEDRANSIEKFRQRATKRANE